MDIIGVYQLSTSLDDNAEIVKQKFFIVPQLTETCILGIDFITENALVLDGENRRVTYKIKGKTYSLIADTGTSSYDYSPIIQLLNATVAKAMNKGENTAVKVETPISKVVIDDVNSEIFRNKIDRLLELNKDVIADKLCELGQANGIRHHIKTTGKVVYLRPRRQARAHLAVIEKEVNEMLKYNIIRPSSSSYSSPIHLTDKKDGTKRFCIDFRNLNTETEKDKYPIPIVDETKDYLLGARYFSTLDLISGYWQIEIDEADKHKTAFTTSQGHYEFNRMPFGLTNAPATFQRLMNNILQPVIHKFALVYLDDVIIYSKTIDDHIEHIQRVLNLLREGGLKIKLSKCLFLQKSVKYLGHIISEDGLRPDPKLTEAIRKYPTPQNKNHVKSFLGLSGYYRKFIWDYANKARALTILTRQKEEFRWGPEEENTFQFLKTCLLENPILRFPDFDLEFIVQTDASGFAVGSVLAQRKIVNGEKVEYAVAYASQQLDDTQEKWHTTDKEAYAIYHALKTFYHYLYGTKFTVETDHEALKGFPKITENMSKKVIRWALFANEFDFVTVFRPGAANQNADSLSRIPETKEVVTSGQTHSIKALTTETFLLEQEKDKFCSEMRKRYLSEQQRRKELMEDYLNAIGETGESAKKRRRNVENESDSDSDDDEQIKELQNGLLGTADGRILVPKTLREKILLRFHDSPFAGHLGVKKTTARIQRRFKWPRMVKEIREYIRNCELCVKRKGGGDNKSPLNPIPPPDHVWQCMAMDIMGPLTPSGINNHKYILVMGEYLTRYVTVASMPDETAESVAKAFITNIITRHGVPETVLTDQGQNFLSKLMECLYKQCGVKAIRTSAYRPQCDGMVERVNRTLADTIACYVKDEPNRWTEFLDVAAFAYNTAVHSSTGYSPFYLMYGREAREPSDLMPPARNRNLTDINMLFSQQWYDALRIAKDRLIEAKEKQKFYYDRNTKRIEYKVGDKVLMKQLAITPGKFNNRWDGPYTVKEKKGNVSYRIISEDGKKLVVAHADRLKKFQGRTSPEATPAETAEKKDEGKADEGNAEGEKAEEGKLETKKRARFVKQQNIAVEQPRYNLRQRINSPKRLQY